MIRAYIRLFLSDRESFFSTLRSIWIEGTAGHTLNNNRIEDPDSKLAPFSFTESYWVSAGWEIMSAVVGRWRSNLIGGKGHQRVCWMTRVVAILSKRIRRGPAKRFPRISIRCVCVCVCEREGDKTRAPGVSWSRNTPYDCYTAHPTISDHNITFNILRRFQCCRPFYFPVGDGPRSPTVGERWSNRDIPSTTFVQFMTGIRYAWARSVYCHQRRTN